MYYMSVRFAPVKCKTRNYPVNTVWGLEKNYTNSGPAI